MIKNYETNTAKNVPKKLVNDRDYDDKIGYYTKKMGSVPKMRKIVEKHQYINIIWHNFCSIFCVRLCTYII